MNITKRLSLIIVLLLAIVSGYIYRFYVPPDAAQSSVQLVQSIPVSLAVQGKTYSFSVPAGSSVYDMMRQAQDQALLMFNAKDFKGLGKFIDEINTIKNSDTDKMYWVYYLNGQSATEGVSQYKLKAGDVIKWEYEKSTF